AGQSVSKTLSRWKWSAKHERQGREDDEIGLESAAPVPRTVLFFFLKQKTAYELGLGIPAEPLFRSRITRTENILHRNFTRRQVAIQNTVASNIGISQSTFSVKVLNLFSRSRRKTNKRKSKHSAMLRNKETRHRMFIGLL